ncbi:MAG: iron-sulfur cluster assembly scaffold protein [Chloroflexaceae bacterium]|nr:iron-sulfur cluster assembly scaffold protein [Chloroflexaceae bacterium]
MNELYSEEILEHSRYPSNFGTLEHATHSFEAVNPLCGDKVRIDLIVADDVVQQVKFSGKGCAISMASASMLTEVVLGQPLQWVQQFDKDDLLELIGIPLQRNPVRLKCALLALKALKAGLYDIPDATG